MRQYGNFTLLCYTSAEGSKKKVEACTWCGAIENHEQHRINLATDGKHNTRWRSLAKLEGTELQKLNITLIFRQVRLYRST